MKINSTATAECTHNQQEVKWHFNSIAWLRPPFGIISHQPVAEPFIHFGCNYTLKLSVALCLHNKIWECALEIFVWLAHCSCPQPQPHPQFIWNLWALTFRVNSKHQHSSHCMRWPTVFCCCSFRFYAIHPDTRTHTLSSSNCIADFRIITNRSVIGDRWKFMPIEIVQEQSDCIENASFFSVYNRMRLFRVSFFLPSINPQRMHTINDIASMQKENNIVQRK